jgi:hypothetical protein
VRSSTGVAGGTSGKGLFGVAANLRTVFRAPLQSGGFPNAFSMFTQSYDVLDIVPLNWDSDSDMELAILDTHGVQVREQDGTSRLNRTGQNAGDAIAVVHMDGFTDSLAWITRLSGWSKLLFFNQNFTTQGPQPITTGTFHSMANADIDSDGDDDLVLASSASNALLVLTNNTPPPVPPPTPPTPPSTWFSVSTPSIDMSMLCDGSVSSGKVLCANLYNQWVDSNWEDDDAVTPPRPVPAFALVLPNVAGVDGLRILPQQGEGQQQSIADFASVWYEGARWLNETLCDTPLDPVEDEEIYWSNWKLTLGSGWGLTNATHMEMVVRKCPEDSTVPDEQLHHGSHLILPAEVPAAIPNFELNFHGAENGSDEDLAFDYRYYVELRPIKMSGPTVLRVWRWSIMGLSPTCDGTIALRGLPGAGGPLFGINFTHCCGTPESDCSTTYSPGAVVVPSAIPLSEIPSGPGYPGDPPPPEQ